MKSSSQTFIFRYFFPVMMIGMPLIFIFNFQTEGTEDIYGFQKVFLVMYLWMLYFLIQMPIRLRSIEAKDNGVLVDKKQLIEYKDIVWLTKFDLTAPYFVTIKYRDRVSGSSKKIAFMPNQKTQADRAMFGDDSLTAYIKNMVKESESNFTREQAPSYKKNFIFIMLLSLPVTLLTFYFINETFNFF